jgi:hypothetical protein
MPKSARLGTITIANGQTQGNILSNDYFAGARQLCIHGPATLAETVTVQAAPEITALPADLRSLKYNGGAAITMTGPSSMVVDWSGGRSISLVAGAAVAADRVFTVSAVF